MYSTVTTTGPWSGASSLTMFNAGQCTDGERSSASPGATRKRRVAYRPMSKPMPAAGNAIEVPAWLSTFTPMAGRTQHRDVDHGDEGRPGKGEKRGCENADRDGHDMFGGEARTGAR